MLPIVLPEAQVQELFRRAAEDFEYQVLVDLEACTVSDVSDLRLEFEIDAFRRRVLLEGLDDIGLTLQYEARIREFEASRQSFR